LGPSALRKSTHTLAGLDLFFDEWEIGPGDVLVHKLDEGILTSHNGILVVSAESLSRPLQQEYAAMMTRVVAGKQNLIPVHRRVRRRRRRPSARRPCLTPSCNRLWQQCDDYTVIGGAAPWDESLWLSKGLSRAGAAWRGVGGVVIFSNSERPRSGAVARGSIR
jgi:TIR domain